MNDLLNGVSSATDQAATVPVGAFARSLALDSCVVDRRHDLPTEALVGLGPPPKGFWERDSWAGCWTLLIPSAQRLPYALSNAEATPKLSRPTRLAILVHYPPPVVQNAACALCLKWGVLLIFQNPAADAILPLAAAVSHLRDTYPVRVTWHDFNSWPPPPVLSLLRNRASRPQPPSGASAWLRTALLGDSPGPSPFQSRPVLRALGELEGLPAFARRAGVIPDSFADVLEAAHRSSTGQSLSLARRGILLSKLRAGFWDATVRACRGAHLARAWLFEADPASRVLRMQEQYRAMAEFQRSRKTWSGPGRSAPTPDPGSVRRSGRKRRRPSMEGFSVAWMGAGFITCPAPPGPLSAFNKRRLLRSFNRLV